MSSNTHSIESMAVAPSELRLYTIAEASRLAFAPRQTVEHWVNAHFVVDTVSATTESPQLLTFADLISLLVVRELRKSGVGVETIRGAEEHLAKLWGTPKPFAHGDFQTGYGAIVTVIKDGERPAAVRGKSVQEILYELIKRDLKNVSYDAAKRAALWRPREHIALRPDLQFGQPCIEGTRVTTRTIRQFLSGGDTVQELAQEFDISVDKIEAALKYEEMLAKRRN